MIIVTIIALAALVAAIIANRRLTAESERLKDEINGLGVAVKTLQSAVDNIDKETHTFNLEGMSYNPRTTTMTIDGNLVVKGSVAAGKSATKKNGLSRED